MSLSIAPIKQNTLADEATEAIRRAIIRGELSAGERLSESALATQLGISRSPIREALQRLENEGLVATRENRGRSVWSPAPADVEEIMSLRIMLECLAAEWALPKLGDKALAHLEAIIEQQREAIEDEDYLKLINEDKRFHEYIVELADHSRLMEWWQQIISQWAVLIYRRLQHTPDAVVGTVLPDHGKFMEAYRDRDLDRVIALHRTINQRVSESVQSALRNGAGAEESV